MNNGDGYGDGLGGFGFGYSDSLSFGFFNGNGEGYSYGIGFSDGYGEGYSFSDDYDYVLCATDLPKVRVTADTLLAVGACEEGIAEFSEVFPNGALYPDDLKQAITAGLDVGWITRLGLPMEVLT